VLSFTTAFLTGLIETLVLLYFFLATGDHLMRKLVRVVPSFENKRNVIGIVHDVQHSISTFLFTITVVNLCLGTLVAFGVYSVGMSNALLWGVLAALLNFIPYFGPFTGVVILAIAGLLTFDSVGRGLLPPLIYLGLHAIESNFVTPMVLGRRLTLNPVVIFLSLMFWMWLWGIPGALLAVPLLMTLKILCDHFKPLAPVGELLK
jgi:predicted PurR-regulated permease PerM